MRRLLIAVMLMLLAGCVADTPEQIQNEEGPTVAADENISNLTVPEPEPQIQSNGTVDTVGEETPPPEPAFDFNYTDGNGTLRVFFFHTPACSACQDTYPAMEELEGKFPNVEFINYSLATQEGREAYVKFAELHNLSNGEQMVPQVLVNGTILTDQFHIKDELEPLLQNLTQ